MNDTTINGKFKDYTFLGSGAYPENVVNIDISEYSYLYCYINYPSINSINPTLVFKDLLANGANQIIRTYWSPEIGAIFGSIEISGNTLLKIRTNSPNYTLYVYGVK